MRLIVFILSLFIATNAIAQTQKTRAQLTTEFNTNFADNSVGAITPALARTTYLDMMASWQAINATAPGDAAYSMVAGDRYVYTTSLSSARVWTLPAASSLNKGESLIVIDAAGVITPTNTISVARNGTDTINGGSSPIVLSAATAGARFVSDGVSNWGAITSLPSGTQAPANTFFAGATSGGLGSPIFRLINTLDFDAAFCNTIGQIITRLTGAWVCSSGSPANPVWWGADPTGVSDSASAINSALAASNYVRFPPGTYKVNSQINYTVSANKSVTIEGSGADVTLLDFPNVSAGIALSLANVSSSFHVRYLTAETAQNGTSNGLVVTVVTPSTNGATWALNDITNLTLRGDDGYSVNHYWSNGVSLTGPSNVNIIGLYVTGSNGNLGNGLILAGVDNSHLSVVFNITQSIFNTLSMGINYSSYVQGVTISQTNLTSDVVAVGVTGSGNLDQLSMVGNQINIVGIGSQCVSGSGCRAVLVNNGATLNDFMFTNNEVINTSNSGTGLELQGTTSRYSIVGNQFISFGASTYALNVCSSAGTCVDGYVAGNVITGYTTAINTSSAHTGTMVFSGNDLTGSTGKFGGTFSTTLKIVDNPGYNPVGVQASTSTGTGANTFTAGPSPETHYINGGTAVAFTIGGQPAPYNPAGTTVHLGPNESYVLNMSVAGSLLKSIH